MRMSNLVSCFSGAQFQYFLEKECIRSIFCLCLKIFYFHLYLFTKPIFVTKPNICLLASLVEYRILGWESSSSENTALWSSSIQCCCGEVQSHSILLYVTEFSFLEACRISVPSIRMFHKDTPCYWSILIHFDGTRNSCLSVKFWIILLLTLSLPFSPSCLS